MKSSNPLTAWMLALLVGLSGLMACQPSSPADTASDNAVNNEGVRILDKETFAAAIKKSNAVVVDVRTPGEFEQGHIDKAVNINFFDAEFKNKLLDLNRKKKYYLYCKNEVRSYRAMEFMKTNDFPEVYILKEGWEGWNTARADQ